MANRATATSLVLVLVLVTMLWAGVTAQSSGCINVLLSLSPCLNYIQGNNSSTPSQECCSPLASVVRSSPECLCEVMNGSGSSFGIEVNQTKVMALPAACNVQTPPISQCNATSPSDSPTGTPSGGGSKTVPSTQEEPSSDGNSIKTSLSLLVFLVFAVSYTSIFKTY